MAGQRAVQVVDLEEDALALDGERPEIVLAVGVVVRIEAVSPSG